MEIIKSLGGVVVSTIAGVCFTLASSPAMAGSDMSKSAGVSGPAVKKELLKEARDSLKGIAYPLKVLKEHQLTDDTYFTLMEVNTRAGKKVYPIVVIKNNGIVVGSYFKNGVDISAIAMKWVMYHKVKVLFPSTKGKLEKSVMTKYVPQGKIRGKLYVFVDPLCPFCQMVEKNLKKLADKYGYEIDLVPFIVHGKKAKELAQSFICRNKSFDDYINKNYGKALSGGCAKSSEILKNAAEIEQKLRLVGTPTFITGKGNVVEGADYKRLKMFMSEGR